MGGVREGFAEIQERFRVAFGDRKMPTKIEWTDESWNPVIGCTKVSAGCQNCYAEKMAIRLNGIFAAKGDDDNWAKMSNVLKWDYSEPELYEFGRAVGWNGQVELFHNRLDQPLHWRKPRMIFVCSMSDLFHEAVPFEFINKIALTMARCPQHTFQVLTKRPEIALRHTENWQKQSGYPSLFSDNVWLGVSVENQENLWRIDELMKIQAAVRYVSFEPLIYAPYGVESYLWDPIYDPLGEIESSEVVDYNPRNMLHWAIIGCESGPKRRECKLEWVRYLVEKFKLANLPIFVKQLSINGKVEHDINKFPEWARIRQMPNAK